MSRSIVMIAAAIAAVLPALPRAQGAQPVPAEPVPAQPVPVQPAPAPPPAEKASRLQFSLQAEIGAGNTTGDVSTDTNAIYGAILGLHFAGPLSLEVDYQHAENDFSGSGVFKQDGLLGHLRLDFLRGTLRPFVYAGAGWVHYSANAAALDKTVDRLVVPAGAGLELLFGPLVVGARGEYQWNTEEIANQRIDYWKAVGTVGIRLP